MQLALDIELPDDATLDNFCWGGNTLLEDQIKSTLLSRRERFFYIWGKPGSGKSHLLQAISCSAESNTTYLPLKQLKVYGPEALIGIESFDIICIDDIDEIASDKAFEEALFHLYNRCRDSDNTMLFITGTTAPTHSGIVLPDLCSRLTWGLSFQLQALSEEEKEGVLKARAAQKGLTLTTTLAQYLLNHYSRDMHDLNHLLEKLDKASLAEKRKLTIPFLKQVLGG
jgi:DnaA family protein